MIKEHSAGSADSCAICGHVASFAWWCEASKNQAKLHSWVLCIGMHRLPRMCVEGEMRGITALCQDAAVCAQNAAVTLTANVYACLCFVVQSAHNK